MIYRRNKGFTLIEVLVTAIIASIILAGVTSVFIVFSKNNRDAINMTKNQFVSNFISDLLLKDIRNGAELDFTTSTLKIKDQNKAIIKNYNFNNGTLSEGGTDIVIPYGDSALSYDVQFSLWGATFGDAKKRVDIKIIITNKLNNIATDVSEYNFTGIKCRNETLTVEGG